MQQQFFKAIRAIVPDVEKNGKFWSWAILANDENSWNTKIDYYFAKLQDLDFEVKNQNAGNLRFDKSELQ